MRLIGWVGLFGLLAAGGTAAEFPAAERWNAPGGAVRDGVIELRGKQRAMLKSPAAGPVTIRTVVAAEPVADRPEQYKVAGLVFGSGDFKNVWFLQICERPAGQESKHFVELVMVRNGRYHAQRTETREVVRRNTEFRWENGRQYRLELTLDDTGVCGRLLNPADGTVIAEVRCEFTGDVVKTGTAGVRTENAQARFSDFQIEAAL